jgi:hypothetical protein
MTAYSLARTRFSNALRNRPGDDPAQVYLTPGYILGPVREALGGVIGLDPCTTAANPAGAERFYCPPADGTRLPWDAATIFVNPPYGQARVPWVRRCISAALAGSAVVLLIPAATDTQVFQQALGDAGEIVFVRGRVKFGTLRPNRRQTAASHPSALIGWNTDLTPCARLGVRAPLARPADPRLF